MKTFCAVLALLLIGCSAYTQNDWTSIKIMKSSTCVPSLTKCCLANKAPAQNIWLTSCTTTQPITCTDSGTLEYTQTGLCQTTKTGVTTASKATVSLQFPNGFSGAATLTLTPDPQYFNAPVPPAGTYDATISQNTQNPTCDKTITVTAVALNPQTASGTYVFGATSCFTPLPAASTTNVAGAVEPIVAAFITVTVIISLIITAVVVYFCCFMQKYPPPCLKEAAPRATELTTAHSQL